MSPLPLVALAVVIAAAGLGLLAAVTRAGPGWLVDKTAPQLLTEQIGREHPGGWR